MVNHLDKLDEETITVHNGHCVMDAIASQKNRITEDELLEQFITSTDASRDLIEYELKRILHNGVVCGFIIKTGNTYAIPTLKNTYEADCDKGEGDESKNDESECDEKKSDGVKLTVSSSGSPDVKVRVEPSPSTSRDGTRKRAATGSSCYDPASKKIRDEPCPDAVKLMMKICEIDWTKFKVRRKKRIMHRKAKLSLFSIAEDSDDKSFLPRGRIDLEINVVQKDCDIFKSSLSEKEKEKFKAVRKRKKREEKERRKATKKLKKEREEEDDNDDEDEEDDDAGGGRFKDRKGDDDDDKGPSPSIRIILPRKSTRITKAAGGKCGGRSAHSECVF